MTAITRIPAAPLPGAAPPEPKVSVGLAFAMRDVANPHPDVGARPVPAQVRAEAQAALAEYDALTQSADPMLVRRWVLSISTVRLPNTPMQPELLDACIGGIIAACSGMPAVCFTRETLGDALRSFRFWPTPAEVYALVTPTANAIRRKASALRMVVMAKDQEEPRAPMGDDERERICAGLRELADTLLASAAARRGR